MIPPSLIAGLPTFDGPADFQCFVPGLAAPGGSKTGFGFKRANGSIGVRIVDAGKGNKEWRSVVVVVAKEYMMGRVPFEGALAIRVTFIRPRPKGHFRADGVTLRPNAPRVPITKPDTTKLFRALEDALKGVCWLDDSQVANSNPRKVYGRDPGAFIEIWKEQPL